MQKLWAYMTPIFFGTDLQRQMEKQYATFVKADKQYRVNVAPIVTESG